MAKKNKTMDDFRETANDYERQYNLKGLKIDDKAYDLVDDWETDGYWPNAENQGVYAIFCSDSELLYVGKASLSSSIGSRLASYFVKNQNGTGAATKSGHYWTRIPRYVLTAAVAKSWEAPSLEEYLINKLQPADNQRK